MYRWYNVISIQIFSKNVWNESGKTGKIPGRDIQTSREAAHERLHGVGERGA